MINLILGLLGILPKALDLGESITKAISDQKLALISANSAKERAEIQERIDQLNAQRNILISDNNAKSRFNQWFRGIAFGLPSALAFWKLVVWDNVVGSFVGCGFKGAHLLAECKPFGTPDFSENVWWMVMATVCFYLATSRK